MGLLNIGNAAEIVMVCLRESTDVSKLYDLLLSSIQLCCTRTILAIVVIWLRYEGSPVLQAALQTRYLGFSFKKILLL